MRADPMKRGICPAVFALVLLSAPTPVVSAESPVGVRLPGHSAPPPCTQSGMAYDHARREVVLFGGLCDSGISGDTWIWDGVSWIERTPPVSPSPRFGMGMVYDAARRQVLLFGGFGPAVAETWTWDGTTWAQQIPATSPPDRAEMAMAYDAARGEVVLFGGVGRFGEERRDTWTWDGANWTKETPSVVPSKRQQAGMAYDHARKEVVLFGGGSWNEFGAFDHLRDTWTWNGSSWVEKSPSTSPDWRSDVGMSYDVVQQEVVLFGGNICCSTPGERDDTWVWDGTSWSELATAVGPAARFGMGMVFDVARQETLLFGGDRTCNTQHFGNTWAFEAGMWVERDPGLYPPGPPPRGDMAMAYDADRREVVMFGGFNNCDGTRFGDTWTWDGAAWEEEIPLTSPPPESLLSMAYDGARREVVLVTTSGETWTWDGTDWAQQHPARSPPARLDFAMVYDHARREVVLFGGSTPCCPFRYFNDTWAWDGSTWTRRLRVNPPSSRSGMGMAYDHARREIVLFGGYDGRHLDDTWTWDGRRWNEEAPATFPPDQNDMGMAYDHDRRQVVLFGDGTWTWDGVTWTMEEPATSPPIRDAPGMAYDIARRETVLFGGHYAMSDTWTWAGATWTRRS